jgi:hypothetical protein
MKLYTIYGDMDRPLQARMVYAKSPRDAVQLAVDNGFTQIHEILCESEDVADAVRGIVEPERME